MAFSFAINKPENIGKTLAAVERTVRSGGGYFSGNEQSGYFSGKGVNGRYSVGDKIIITITKKPMLASDSMVKSIIADYFTQK
ncbi:MAG: hypothetical protein FWD71_09280 [Oscillospiraceae bacterium]|nr:hypothetical protein [Oscillospiraceae bacterium]